MHRRVEIATGARLHFGFFSHAPAHGREFGGAGLMVESPGFRVVFEQAGRDEIEVPEPYRDRVARYVSRIRESNTKYQTPGCRVCMTDCIPAHSGLGSGTQLAMAVAQGLSLLSGESDRDPVLLAQSVGRGARSAIGIHGFAHGGFLIDAGKLGTGGIAPLAARCDFPANWQVLLVTPPDDCGISGTIEENAFAALPGMPAKTSDRLRQIAEREFHPAVGAGEFDRFSDAVFEFGQLVGTYFAPAQGGVFASPLMSRLAGELRARGIRGVGQSSWGPTLFAFLQDEAFAWSLTEELAAESEWTGCRFQITQALNRGAATNSQPA